MIKTGYQRAEILESKRRVESMRIVKKREEDALLLEFIAVHVMRKRRKIEWHYPPKAEAKKFL